MTAVPAVWLLICTTAAGLIKIFDPNPALGFMAQAGKYQAAMAKGELLAPAKSMDQMQHIVFNGYLNAGLTALFLLVVASILVYSIRAIAQARRNPERSDTERPAQPIPADHVPV